MPIAIFEALCAIVVVATLVTMARAIPSAAQRLRLAGDYALLAAAGLVGEQTSITLYRHYAYAEGWHARVGDVPALVPLIWPLVILSARAVRQSLFPHARSWQRPLLTGLFVTADASLMEVLATRAGLWSWTEAGHLEVPLLGILAWGYFAGAADALLDRLDGLGRWLVVPGSVLVAHALICASWWYGLRWVLRGDLGLTSVAVVAALGALTTVKGLSLRRAGRLLPRAVVLPRLAATALFVVLFVSSAADAWQCWMHLVSIAVPYWTVTDLGALRSTRPENKPRLGVAGRGP
ncbi:MAG: hypothetical protein OHK0013_34210 [Sandaracinaceae bacterium]